MVLQSVERERLSSIESLVQCLRETTVVAVHQSAHRRSVIDLHKLRSIGKWLPRLLLPLSSHYWCYSNGNLPANIVSCYPTPYRIHLFDYDS